MALRLATLPLQTRLNPKHAHRLQGHQINTTKGKTKKWAIQCVTSAHRVEETTKYQAKHWGYDYILSLRSDYEDDDTHIHQIQIEQLKTNVRHLLAKSEGPLAKLELIDAIKRLGVGYHFEDEIKCVLDKVHKKHVDRLVNDDLYTTTLRFRLLREHGYHVHQDIFNSFKDEMGNFKSSLCKDVRGMLSLYEASHLSFESENIMDEAKAFTTMHLKDTRENIAPTLAKKISHSLDLALHWRVPRVEARWYIDIYESEENMKPTLLQLAKLDYNMVQATHQKELVNVARWSVDLGLENHLSFLRDKLIILFVWFTGMIFEPQFGRCREELTKLLILLTVIDDMYDTYASLDELQLFTDAVERWDLKGIEKCPLYMKILYMAMFNTTNQVGYEILKVLSYDISAHQNKAWSEVCKAFLSEARWDHQGYIPTSKEYIDNGVHSIGVIFSLIHCYFLTTTKITLEAVECLQTLPSLIYGTATILRLADDLAASKGEVRKNSIQCYMHELGVSEDVARKHVRQLISDTWKKLNEARADRHPFEEPFINSAMNECRIAEWFMLCGEGHELISMIVEPIPLGKN